MGNSRMCRRDKWDKGIQQDHWGAGKIEDNKTELSTK